jgi:hypothetical protein
MLLLSYVQLSLRCKGLRRDARSFDTAKPNRCRHFLFQAQDFLTTVRAVASREIGATSISPRVYPITEDMAGLLPPAARPWQESSVTLRKMVPSSRSPAARSTAGFSSDPTLYSTRSLSACSPELRGVMASSSRHFASCPTISYVQLHIRNVMASA